MLYWNVLVIFKTIFFRRVIFHLVIILFVSENFYSSLFFLQQKIQAGLFKRNNFFINFSFVSRSEE